MDKQKINKQAESSNELYTVLVTVKKKRNEKY